jgi:hypothetical protein
MRIVDEVEARAEPGDAMQMAPRFLGDPTQFGSGEYPALVAPRRDRQGCRG